MPALIRLYTDASGESRLENLSLTGPTSPEVGEPAQLRLRDIPTTTLHITWLLEQRPKLDLHPPPRRQFVIVLQGSFEITTTSGDSHVFRSGDCLLAEDMEGRGHTHEDLGEDQLVMVSIGIPDAWDWPRA